MYNKPKLNFDKDRKKSNTMPVFQQSKECKQIPRAQKSEETLIFHGRTNNKWAKNIARIMSALLVIVLISILVISISHLI